MGVRGLAPWSWRVLIISSYQWTNLSLFTFQDVNLTYRRGVRGLAPWSWRILTISCYQLTNSRLFSFQNVNIPAHSTSKGFRGLAWQYQVTSGPTKVFSFSPLYLLHVFSSNSLLSYMETSLSLLSPQRRKCYKKRVRKLKARYG